LGNTFAECGKMQTVEWVTDKNTGKFYGSAFLEFENAAAAKAVS
jgi:hypothetical protein